jgi:probable rRNA maturation factor
MVIFETAVQGVSSAEMQRFVRQAQKLAKVPGEVDILISGSTRLRELNRRFRRKNKPTDVLSFRRPVGGDIAISADIACQNAARYGHGTAEELKVLVLHGMLHLAGYDHESDNGEMARVEARLRSRLSLPASLIDRAHSRSRQPKAHTLSPASRLRKSGRHTARNASAAQSRSPR